jgi:hypothetical protein
MDERHEVPQFRVVNMQSGRALDVFDTERAAEDRAIRELGRVTAGRFRIERRDAPRGRWRHVREVGDEDARERRREP